jgi:hypothetical protein
MKAPIRIWFCDFPGEFNPEKITQLLQTKYELEFDKTSPNYVFFSVFSQENLRYKDSIKIFFTGENVHPDFNLCDYAFGFDRLTFGDRYYRCPNYVLYPHYNDLRKRQKTIIENVPKGRKFCNFIYSNRSGHPFRDEFYHLLSQYKFIHSPGAHLNNTENVIGKAYAGDWCTPKVEYQNGFKFSFAFENSSTPGYTTEKIVHALAADSIPIYWGDPEVGRDFNSERFVNLHECTPKEAVQRIIELDQNDQSYNKILDKSFFPKEQLNASTCTERLLKDLSAIFEQPLAQASRRNKFFWGLRYETEAIEAEQARIFLRSKSPYAIIARALFRACRSLH